MRSITLFSEVPRMELEWEKQSEVEDTVRISGSVRGERGGTGIGKCTTDWVNLVKSESSN